jgi:hypothetical protein
MRLVLVLAACCVASACSTPVDAPLSPTFGQAVASMQSQIIPVEVSELPPEGSGARGAAAIARYQKGEVRKLETQTTSALTINLLPTPSK